MKLPPGALDEVFEKEFRKGALLKTRLLLSDGGVHEKFLLVLNHHPPDADTLFFLATSQVEFYNRHPNVEHVRLQAGTVEFFPLETVINCREVYQLTRSEIKRRYTEGALRFLGHLSSELMQKVDEQVVKCRLISLRHKKAILGWT